MKKDERLRKMVLTGLLSAICFIATFINVPNPFAVNQEGLMHLGGVVLMVSALYMGPYIGGLVGAVGMGLFDLVYGPIWLPGTVVIRFFMGMIIGVMNQKIKGRIGTLLALVVGSLFMMVGYYLYTAIFITHDFYTPLATSLAGDGIASIISTIIVISLDPLFKRIFIKFDKMKYE